MVGIVDGIGGTVSKRTAIAGAITAWSALTARNTVPPWDTRMFLAANSLPDGVAPVAWLPMQAGALGAPLAIGALTAVRGHRRTGTRIAVTGAAAWGAAKVLKAIVGRGRPGDHIESTVLRLGSADDGLGFPSGHAAVAATLAMALPPDTPWAVRLAAFGLATTVGIARVYVGAHYPLDVVGGWALGVALGDIANAVDDRLASDPT